MADVIRCYECHENPITAVCRITCRDGVWFVGLCDSCKAEVERVIREGNAERDKAKKTRTECAMAACVLLGLFAGFLLGLVLARI